MDRLGRNEGEGGGVLDLIGGTPMAGIRRLSAKGSARILAKLESFNPGASVKDRIALAMVEDAERRNLLPPGGAVIEPTSGNTGIGLAMVCAVKGYSCVLTMPETMSRERIRILELFGARVVLTPGGLGMRGAVEKAESLLREIPGACMPNQFKNPANPRVHGATTGPEILRQTGGIDAFVAGVGTGGTITGAGWYLKRHNPGVRVIAVEPGKSPVLSGGRPGSHGIQGIGAGFIPDVLDTGVIDEVIAVSDEDAFETAGALSAREGIFCGISSGAAMFAALRTAEKLGAGRTVAVILPDTGERYLSLYAEAGDEDDGNTA